MVAKLLDTKGLCCPMPVVKAKKAIAEVGIGEVLEIVSTDPGAVPDFQAWSRATGHELLKTETGNGVFTFHIKRTK